MTRVGAVDCGTNSVKLLVTDLDVATGTQRDLARELRIVRLGEGVDRTGRISQPAMDRLLAALEEYAAILAVHDVARLRFVATSAMRDAENADLLVAGVRERLGVDPEVVTGDEEAALSYDGATRSLPSLPAPVVLVDIGGGSTEVVLGGPDGRVAAARSLDLGSVRLTERLMPSDPPTRAEVEAAVAVVDRALDTLCEHGVHVETARTVVGVAGTVTTLATLLLGSRTWDRDRVHGRAFPAPAVHELAGRLLAMTVREREALGVPTGRSDVVGAGAVLLDRLLARTGAETLTVSDADILDGIAWSLATRP